MRILRPFRQKLVRYLLTPEDVRFYTYVAVNECATLQRLHKAVAKFIDDEDMYKYLARNNKLQELRTLDRINPLDPYMELIADYAIDSYATDIINWLIKSGHLSQETIRKCIEEYAKAGKTRAVRNLMIYCTLDLSAAYVYAYTRTHPYTSALLFLDGNWEAKAFVINDCLLSPLIRAWYSDIRARWGRPMLPFANMIREWKTRNPKWRPPSMRKTEIIRFMRR